MFDVDTTRPQVGHSFLEKEARQSTISILVTGHGEYEQPRDILQSEQTDLGSNDSNPLTRHPAACLIQQSIGQEVVGVESDRMTCSQGTMFQKSFPKT